MFSRRQCLQLLSAALPAARAGAQTPLAFPGKRSLLVHNDYPEDLETPVEYFDTWLTPNDRFFVRQHLPRPRIDAAAWRLDVTGLASTPLKLSLDDLKKLPQYRVPATLECAGNGRSNFRPRMPGLQWSKGAIGNAEWRGPRLAGILKSAGVSNKAAYGNVDGADVGVGKTPDFIRSIPVRKLMHEATILALEMNGEPLPEIHGFPARLIVPGWDGASWVKWVTKLDLSEQPDSGFYFATAYRYPKHPVAPGVAPKPEEMDVIGGMAVKSIFAKPADQAKLKMVPHTLQGVAWGGENRVVRVEVSTDAGAKWQDARLSTQDFPFAWRLWSFNWTPAQPGYHLLMSRATDSAGRIQPIEALWNPSGYLWNSIDRIAVVVEA